MRNNSGKSTATLLLVSAEVTKFYCVVPENIHTHTLIGHWKFQVSAGLKSQ